MTTLELIAHLQRLDVRLYVKNGALRCDAPEGRLTPELRNELRTRREGIIAFLNERECSEVSEPVSLVAAGPSSLESISFAQQRLWFLDQLQGPSANYNISLAIRFRGRLSVMALRASLQEIVNRHASLRTAFEASNHGPVGKVAERLEVEVPVVETVEASVAEIYQEFAARAFDLSCVPLIRAMLLRITDRNMILLVNIHHIVCDGWSMGVLARELSVLYPAFARGKQSPLPPLTVQYADYASWERRWLTGKLRDRQTDYWRRKLADMPPRLELPTDRPRPQIQAHRGGQVPFRLSQELSDRLSQFSRSHGCTLFMTMLATFQLLLSRYADTEDVGVACPIANRTRWEFEQLIGFFANTLVLRGKLAGDPTFLDLLLSTRGALVEAYSNQSIPFHHVVEVLRPDRSLSYAPLVQVELVFQNLPPASLSIPGVQIEIWEPESRVTKFDLSLAIFESERGIRGRLEYDVDLFDRPRIESMCRHYTQLLGAAAARPFQRLSMLETMENTERETVVSTWNQTRTPFSEDRWVHQLVEDQVDRTPDAVAAFVGDHHLTYRALDSRANRLGWWLRDHGIGPEEQVALACGRSLEAFVSILAILKAGGAYVPLDPAFPVQRLELVKRDMQARVLLTAGTNSIPPMQEGGTTLDVSSGWADLVSLPSTRIPSLGSTMSLAYILYTSGSTGRPKGVALQHRLLVNLLEWYRSSFPLSAADRSLQFASISFDVSFEEAFTTWTTGGCLVLAAEEDRLDPPRLLQFISEQGIARMILPVAVFQQLAETHRSRPGSQHFALRQIITSGSQLQITPDILTFMAALPDCELHNNYGPSETHAVSRHPMGTACDVWPTLPPIGRPLQNAELYVVDRNGVPLPVGVPGELCVGGVAVGRGYWKRPDLTARSFVPDHFSGRRGERLYRTGDMVKWQPNGNLLWLGRRDEQLKVRGCRVEAGEVEAVLKQHPSVGDAAVLVRRDTAGHELLVAYVQQAEDVGDTFHAALRTLLEAQLPDYMIPSAIVTVAKFPFGLTGKIDRKALPPFEESARMGSGETPPRDRDEAVMADIWRDVLGVQSIGIHDNFFEIGGHSLLATQIISRLRTLFGVEMPIRALFEAPTIAALTRRAKDQRSVGSSETLHAPSASPDAGWDEDEVVL